MLLRKSVLPISILPGYNDTEQYSDGPSEHMLLDLFRGTEAAQINSHIQEILTNNPSWQERVHLSPQRHHLLDWFNFRHDTHLLEVGAGCGAMTGLFADRVSQVDALEPSTRRAEILAHRHGTLSNVRVLVGNLQTLSENSSNYSYIVAIGVLEYAGMKSDANQVPAEDTFSAARTFLSQVRRLMSEGGTLLLAIENQIGLKYLAGYAEDHYGQSLIGIEDYLVGNGVRTYARPELQRLLEDSNFSIVRWYYPFPDYKLPTSIYSDDLLPGSLEHPANMYPTIDYAHPSGHYFAESRFASMLYRNKLTGLFSNSFLVICTTI